MLQDRPEQMDGYLCHALPWLPLVNHLSDLEGPQAGNTDASNR